MGYELRSDSVCYQWESDLAERSYKLDLDHGPRLDIIKIGRAHV